MSRPVTSDFDIASLLAEPFYCTGCAERVCERVVEIHGVVASECDAEQGTLTVTYDESDLSAAELAEVVRRLALEATGAMRHAVYRVTGLD